MTEAKVFGDAVIRLSGPWCTDELLVRFYECSSCGFDRVPRITDDDAWQTNYCPYCGVEIEWVE
jgi:DNA-directed RNA polymerase subunit RPC12/RpoP